MLRFVIVAFLLIALLIFYVTRLGEGDGRVPESQLSGASSSEPSSGRVEAALPANEESLQERRGTEGIAYDADPRLSLVPNTFGCDIETLAANASPSSHLRGRRDEDQIERLLQTLTASGDAELQLATGLLVLSRDWATDDMRSRYGTMASIERAYATDPTNPSCFGVPPLNVVPGLR